MPGGALSQTSDILYGATRNESVSMTRLQCVHEFTHT